MEDELDLLLQRPLLRPPPDFTEQVMERIQQLPAREPAPHRQSAWEWLARGPALFQLLAFMFGIWAASAAG